MIDIWLPDAKYTDDAAARRLSGFRRRYVENNRAALREISRQVGDKLVLDEDGIARRGMIIRHLVLPGGLANTPGVMRWIATELYPGVHISVMDQYFPAYKALNDPLIGPQEDHLRGIRGRAGRLRCGRAGKWVAAGARRLRCMMCPVQ